MKLNYNIYLIEITIFATNIADNSSLNKLVKLSDQDLVNELLKRLSAINERLLNKDGKLESYDCRSMDRMVIKKI